MADPFAELDRLYSGLGFPATRRTRSPTPTLPPELESGLLHNLANYSLPLISYVGGSLDKPGRAVRGAVDMLTGGDTPASELLAWVPFSDKLGFTSEANAASGRDIMENLGAPANVEGFFNSPTDSALDVAGFGAEVLLDPLTYLTMGASAAGKAGKIATKAGLLPKTAAGRASSTLKGVAEDLFEQMKRADEITAPMATEKFKALQNVADQAGISMDDILNGAIGSEKLGGAWSVGIPGMDPLYIGDRLPWDSVLPMAGSALRGAGRLARKVPVVGDPVGSILEGIPRVGDKLGREGRRLFDSRVKDQRHRGLQDASVELTERESFNKWTTRDEAGKRAQQRAGAGLIGPEHEDELWELVEGQRAEASHPLLRQQADEIRSQYEELLNLKKSYGKKIDALDDPGTDYAFRQLYGGGPSSKGKKSFDLMDKSTIAREEALKGIPGGTAAIRRVAREVDRLGAAGDETVIKAIVESAGIPEDNVKGMAKFLASLNSEQLAKGAFSGDPVVMAQRYRNRALDQVHAIDKMFDVIKQYANDGMEGIKIRDVLKAADLNVGDSQAGALMRLSEKFFGPGKINHNLLDNVIPEEVAEGIANVIKGYTKESPVNSIIELADSFTNLWKAGVLTRPARYVRDFVSAAWQNVVGGVFSKSDYATMDKLLRSGDTIQGIQKQFPKFGSTDKEVTDALRRGLFSTDLIGHYKGRDILGSEKIGRDNSLEELLRGFTGAEPFSWRAVGKKAVGKASDTTWNPGHVRGVFGQEATRFAPVAAGEDVGFYTDSVNRGAAWLNMVRKGTDPQTAAKKAKAMHVDYSHEALTKTESKVLTRLFPFYRFARGMVPWTLRELYERPGGAVAQSVKATARNRDDSRPLPERVQNSLSIPLGSSEDGTRRYLSNLGLMYEDPLQLGQVGPGLSGTVMGTFNELLSRSNPLIKGVAELGTGQLMFGGGQDIRDADPALGRTISNMGSVIGADIDPEFIRSRTGILPEYIAATAPYVGNVANLLRTATDPRKRAGDNFTESALNFAGSALPNMLTGFKVTDVSPQAQNRVLNDLIRESVRDAGGSVFETPYLPEHAGARMSDEQRRVIDELLMLDRQQQKQRKLDRALKQ